MDFLSWVMLVTLAIVWGAAFVFVGHAVEYLPVITVAALRTGIAAVGLLLLCAVLRTRLPRSSSEWGALAVMGVLNNIVPFGLITFGQSYVASGLASVLNAMTPIAGLLVGWAILRVETMTIPKWIGLLSALTGVVILSGPEALKGLGDDLVGQAAILAATISYAFAGYWGRRLANLSSLVAATGQLVVSGAFMTVAAFMFDAPFQIDWGGAWEVGALPAMIICALLSTACAYLLFFEILRRAGPVNTMTVTYLIPPAAILIAWFALDETPTWSLAVACLCIFVGIALASGKRHS